MAASPEDVGARVEFVGDLEEGNFHVIAMSSLLARNSKVVPTVALAEMQHDRVVRPAPVGPMALTGNAWLHAAEEVERGSTPRAAEYQIEVRDRTSRELDLRSFSQSQPGTSGHFVDEDRDLARRDRRFARSSSQLTPELFANMVESRWFNETTATIEEVDQTEGRLAQLRRCQGLNHISHRQPFMRSRRWRAFCRLLHLSRQHWLQSSRDREVLFSHGSSC